MNILAIDPGLTHPAGAVSVDGKLLAASRLKVPGKWSALEILDRCELIGLTAAEWAYAQLDGNAPDIVIVEWPQWYGEKGYKRDEHSIDPNDLAGLCGIAGATMAHVRRIWGRHVKARSPKPREVWGNQPKSTTGPAWESPRARKLARRLRPGEREVIQDKHDALDAAGLALFADGRWETVRLYPGAV